MITNHNAPLDGDLGEAPTVTEARDQAISVLVSTNVVKLSPSVTVREAAVALRTDEVSLAVVGEGSNIDGVISERDLVSAIANGGDLDSVTVGEIKSDSLSWAVVTSSVDDVAEEMLESYLRHILVREEDGSLAGIVSMRDLLAAMMP